MEDFIDQQVIGFLEGHHIPGAIVTVVRGEQIVLAKGYGFADLETQRPMCPETTLMRIASITKLFTWTAVMQLVEQGRLDLHADIQTYLDFEIPQVYAEPIRLWHLLSHTAGFADYGILTGALDAPQETLRETLIQRLPACVYPPGQVIAYSNYGAGLAGYIVERVSGMGWEEYVEAHILAPLAMTHTTPREPLPPALDPVLAASYTYKDGVQKPFPFLFNSTPPDGSISATAVDMAHFMIAHLQGGAYGEARILREETVQQMHSQLFTHHSLLPGNAHGFSETRRGGQRILYHTGGWESFANLLMLIPEQQLGLFVAFNGDGGDQAIGPLLIHFVEHFYPTPPPSLIQPLATFDRRAATFTGYYHSTRAAFHTVEKLTWLINAEHIAAWARGVAFRGAQWVQISPECFRDAAQERYLCFQSLPEAKLQLASTGTNDYRRLAWYQTPPFNIALVLSCALVLLSGLVVWLLAGRYGIGGLPFARGAVIAVALGHLLTLATLGVVMGTGTEVFTYRVPAAYFVLRGLVWLALALTVSVVICAVAVWLAAAWPLGWCVYYTFMAFTAFVFAGWMLYWRLLSVG